MAMYSHVYEDLREKSIFRMISKEIVYKSKRALENKQHLCLCQPIVSSGFDLMITTFREFFGFIEAFF